MQEVVGPLLTFPQFPYPFPSSEGWTSKKNSLQGVAYNLLVSGMLQSWFLDEVVKSANARTECRRARISGQKERN